MTNIYTISLFLFSIFCSNQGQDECEREFWSNIEISDLDNLEVIKGPTVNCQELPSRFYTLTNLKVVQIDPHGLLKISPDIQNLTKLERLEITKSNLTTLPKEIGELQNLRVLTIGWGGQLKSVPQEIGNLENLEVLDLWRNNLTILPKTIGNLKNLKQLRLGENNFSQEERSRIRELLPNCEIIFDY